MSKAKKSVKEDEYKQLGLEIKEPFSNKFYKIKRDFDTTVLKFEILKFLKDPILWAMLVIGAILILYQIYAIQKDFDSLPQYLPIYKYFMIVQDKLVEKKFIWIYPIISTAILIPSLILIPRNYNREKSLIKLLMIVILLCIIAQSIILIELLSLR